MLLSDQRAEFNPHGRNGIIKLDQDLDNVTVSKLTSWTGGSIAAQHWVDIQYALLELAKERRYDLMQSFYASTTGFPTVYAAQELNIPSIVSIRGNDIIRDVFKSERFPYLLVQSGSATKLCKAMLRMLDTNTDRQQYGKQAQERVLTEFAPQKELESYWKVYLESLSSK